jgi:hypothetical protein
VKKEVVRGRVSGIVAFRTGPKMKDINIDAAKNMNALFLLLILMKRKNASIEANTPIRMAGKSSKDIENSDHIVLNFGQRFSNGSDEKI